MSWRTIKGKKKKKVIHPLFFSIEHVHHVAKDSNDRAAPKIFPPRIPKLLEGSKMMTEAGKLKGLQQTVQTLRTGTGEKLLDPSNSS